MYRCELMYEYGELEILTPDFHCLVGSSGSQLSEFYLSMLILDSLVDHVPGVVPFPPFPVVNLRGNDECVAIASRFMLSTSSRCQFEQKDS